MISTKHNMKEMWVTQVAGGSTSTPFKLKHYCSWQKGLISPLPLSTSSFTSLLAIVPAPFLQPSVILKSFCEPIHMANSKEISRFRVEFFSVCFFAWLFFCWIKLWYCESSKYCSQHKVSDAGVLTGESSISVAPVCQIRNHLC